MKAIEVEIICHNGALGGGGVDISVYRVRKFSHVWHRVDDVAAAVTQVTSGEIYTMVESDAGLDTTYTNASGSSLFLTVTGKAATEITWSYVISYYTLLEQ